MDTAFWLERWQLNQIGFHLQKVHPILLRHWPRQVDATNSPVLVPLAGKSLDLDYLRDRGHPVTGIELSGIAIRDFFKERDIPAVKTALSRGVLYEAPGIRLIEDDFFAVSPQTVGEVAVVYDRAALIAMPPEKQPAYVAQLKRLKGRAPLMLITLEYDETAMNGPPFSVGPDRIKALFDVDHDLHCIETMAVLAENPSLQSRGLKTLTEAVWWLTPKNL